MGGFAAWAGTSVGFAVLAAIAVAGAWLALRVAGVHRWTTLADLLLAVSLIAILVITLRGGREGQPTEQWQVLPFQDLIAALDFGAPRSIGLAVTDLLGNVLLFLPFGAALAMRWPDLRAWRPLLAAFGLSLAVEVAQFVAPLGRSAQTTDILMNTLGGWLGWAVASWLQRRGSGRLSGADRRRR